MPLDAIVFDLDGTLIDTNAIHVRAWEGVFKDAGYVVAADRIFVEIGKGGDQLVPAILGKSADEKDGDALRKAHPKAFAKIALAEGLRPFDGAVELVRAIQSRGLKTILATSSGKEHLDTIEKASGIDVRKLLGQLVTGDDAKRSKPAPDLVTVAVKKLKLSPAQCAMVGDTPYDVESAKHAGLVTLGLTCGGNDAATLLKAGARRAYRDPADLLTQLAGALHDASPASLILTSDELEKLMRLALAQADAAIDAGEAPIGCVLCAGDGRVIAEAFNEANRSQGKTAHAEMVAFARAAGKVPPDAKDLILVSTLEPCVMCTGAAMEASVDAVIYGLKAPADSGTARVAPPISPESQMPRIVGDILADEVIALFKKWLKKSGPTAPPAQVAYVKQLLQMHGK